jgi:hypothetical protein
MNHYYDSLAFVDTNNISYIDNANTCIFEQCLRCKNKRKKNNIILDTNLLIPKKQKEVSVNSAFGGCFFTKTEYFNNCEYDEKLFLQCNHVCEHVSFNKQLLKNGKIILNTDIIIKMVHS